MRYTRLGKTDLLFTVPAAASNCPNYKAQDCVEYVRSRLQGNHLNTYTVDGKTLFVTWLYIEVNKEVKDVNTDTKALTGPATSTKEAAATAAKK